VSTIRIQPGIVYMLLILIMAMSNHARVVLVSYVFISLSCSR